MSLIQTIFVLFLGLQAPDLSKEAVNVYINQHREIAISEMNRTGIPASIKLAQGLLESSFGSSALASEANNHFGIKCGGQWTGGEYYLKDDDYKNGKLINSCFRKYNSSYESYIAHSEFLKDESKKHRYGFLFRYDKTDYESWAHGLRDAGYATDPQYPNKLISIIEKYELYKFDNEEGVYVNIEQYKSKEKKSSKPRKEVVEADIVVSDKSKQERIKKSEAKELARKYRTKEVNNVRCFVSSGQETVMSFAKNNSLKVSDLIKYNEEITSSANMLTEGDYVYIEEKKKNFDGYKKEHRVKEGEDMYTIAQKYGVRLRSLYAKNRLPLDSEILPGQTLSLKGRVKLGDRPDFILNEKDNRKEKSKFLF